MSKILHRTLNSTLPVLSSGRGVWVSDNKGNSYLDASAGGVAVTCLGHGNDRVIAAIARQLNEVSYFHTSFFTSDVAEELAASLVAEAPGDLSQVVFSCGGSEAVEAALKLARQYWVEKGEPGRSEVISRHQSYHGGTLGTLAVGGNIPRRETYSPLLFGAHFISPCYQYRLAEEGETEEEYGVRAAAELEEKILELGPERVAMFICEPVVGATLGCVPASKGYLKEVRRICDAYGVILIFDEVMCGAGRTGTYFSCEYDGVYPDIMAIAKGLGGGFQAIGATLVSAKIADAIQNGTGLLKHGFTYMGHNSSCAAALEVFRIIHQDDLLSNVKARGYQLRSELERVFANHPHVGDVRGRGLFIGLELVADRKTKECFSSTLKVNGNLKKRAFDNGLLIYPNGGTVDGSKGDHVVFSPAYTVSEEEISQIVERFSYSLDQVFHSI
jgi:adenosylmethionine-8-amino-7-oxononanoate aminotransferase